jgi:hypothetical protein
VQSVLHVASKHSASKSHSLHLPPELTAVVLFSLLGLTSSFALIACLGAADLSTILILLN